MVRVSNQDWECQEEGPTYITTHPEHSYAEVEKYKIGIHLC